MEKLVAIFDFVGDCVKACNFGKRGLGAVQNRWIMKISERGFCDTFLQIGAFYELKLLSSLR